MRDKFGLGYELLIARDDRERKIHTGFSGPATGQQYLKLVAGFNALIDELLDEDTGR